MTGQVALKSEGSFQNSRRHAINASTAGVQTNRIGCHARVGFGVRKRALVTGSGSGARGKRKKQTTKKWQNKSPALRLQAKPGNPGDLPTSGTQSPVQGRDFPKSGNPGSPPTQEGRSPVKGPSSTPGESPASPAGLSAREDQSPAQGPLPP